MNQAERLQWESWLEAARGQIEDQRSPGQPPLNSNPNPIIPPGAVVALGEAILALEK